MYVCIYVCVRERTRKRKKGERERNEVEIINRAKIREEIEKGVKSLSFKKIMRSSNFTRAISNFQDKDKSYINCPRA